MLDFEAFKKLALDPTITPHEKVGFPNEYREGKEEAIFSDICNKLATLSQQDKTVLEIGPGCSRLPTMLADLCARNHNKLIFVDSAEMLSLLPDRTHVEKWPGRYPSIPALFDKYTHRVDVLIAYSVIQYVFAEGNMWDFIDQSLQLLAEGGEILLGDIPNVTMRKRFFSGTEGIKTHQKYTGSDALPEVKFNQLEIGKMDDSLVLAILSRARAQGFHAWVVPQATNLPMANRREDIIIRRP